MSQSSQLWKKAELVLPMNPYESIVGDAVCRGNFGLTIKAGTPVTSVVQSPVAFGAPERSHGEMPTFVTDMWSCYCIFAELYIGRPLIYGSRNDYIINHIVDTVWESWRGSYVAGGSCPESWYEPQRGP